MIRGFLHLARRWLWACCILSLLHWAMSLHSQTPQSFYREEDTRFCQWPFLHLKRQLLGSVFGSTYMMLTDFHTWKRLQISGIKQIFSMCLPCVLEFGFQVFYGEFFVSMFFRDTGRLEAAGIYSRWQLVFRCQSTRGMSSDGGGRAQPETSEGPTVSYRLPNMTGYCQCPWLLSRT